MSDTDTSRKTEHIDLRLYMSLVFLGLFPAVYTALRTRFIGQMPDSYAYSIAGQLSWVSLIYEVLGEAVILPLYFLLGGRSREELGDRLRSGLAAVFAIYAVCSAAVSLFAVPLLNAMAVSRDILPESAAYIRLESIAFVFGAVFDFMMVALVTIGKRKYIYIMAAAKCALCATLDILLISPFSISLHMGVNGIALSNIITNAMLFITAVCIAGRDGIRIFSRGGMPPEWMRDFAKKGAVSGLESFVRNIAYMFMVSRMVNMVGEQGTYWVANNFIWGWLLLPVLQLGELIKRDVAEDMRNVRTKTRGYFLITAVICLLWSVTIPLYKPFMQNVLGFSDTDKLFRLVILLLVPYMFFAFQNIFDASFYGAGKPEYMLLESIVTNTLFYGAFFTAFLKGAWTPTLYGIAVMFGAGNIFDSLVSGLVYVYFVRHDVKSKGEQKVKDPS